MKDFIILRYCISGLIIATAVAFYYDRIRALYKDKAKHTFLAILIDIICINAVLSLISIVSPQFRDILYSIVDVNELMFTYRISMRLSGVVYTGFGFLSTVYAFAILICFVLYGHETKSLGKFVLFAKILLLLADMFFVGRTGLIVLAIGILCLLAFPERRQDRRAYLRLSFSLPLAVCIIFFIVSRMIDLIKYQEEITWMFDIFIRMLSGDGATTNSTIGVLLSEHLKIPESMLQLLFGDGVYNVGAVRSDIGYIQILFGGGILGIIIVFSIYVSGIVASLRPGTHRDSRKILFILSISLLIVNVKDLYYISYSSYSFIYFMIYLFVAERDEKCIVDAPSMAHVR
jgi:hypothetical protein